MLFNTAESMQKNLRIYASPEEERQKKRKLRLNYRIDQTDIAVIDILNISEKIGYQRQFHQSRILFAGKRTRNRTV